MKIQRLKADEAVSVVCISRRLHVGSLLQSEPPDHQDAYRPSSEAQPLPEPARNHGQWKSPGGYR